MRRIRSATLSVGEGKVDMTPMLDIVFIMLIFFIVTTSFASEVGIPVAGTASEPKDRTVEPAEALAIRIEDGNIVRIDGRTVTVGSVAANLQAALAAEPDRQVVILAGAGSDAGTLVAVADAVRSTGKTTVPVAALND